MSETHEVAVAAAATEEPAASVVVSNVSAAAESETITRTSAVTSTTVSMTTTTTTLQASKIPTAATTALSGIPQSKLKTPTNFVSNSSISKIGRPCCMQSTPKAGPPPRDTGGIMSRESDDNLSSINSAYTDLYQETVKRFTRSSISPTSDWSSMERFTPTRHSLKATNSSNSTRSSPTFKTGEYDRQRTSYVGAVLTADTEQFIIGQKVWVGGIRPGQIAYIGETHFAPGDWAGIVLDEPNGKNDGCVAGKRYFQCEPKRGIFSRLTRLTVYPLAGAQTPTSPLSKYSPERSRTVSPTASLRSNMLRSPGTGKNGLTVGDRVIVSSGFGSRPGILRYLGETKFAPGNWCGVELDEPSGKNDGAVDGVRYFECKPKYGVFVPIAKVSLSPSSKKTRLSRTGSRESLTSIGTMNSVATTNTSRMRMNAQRKSSVSLKPVVTAPKFSMQDLLREKQNHIEQLMIERDLDREDSQTQALQLQKNINELKARVMQLETELAKERKKSEELQFSVDEATFCGDELSAQSQVYKEKIHDLEQKITHLASATPSLQTLSSAEDTNSALAAANARIAELENNVRLAEARITEFNSGEERLQDQIKYLQNQNDILQKELVSKDESLEKFSLSEVGIENLRHELMLLKEENERQSQQASAEFTSKLEAKNVELQSVTNELNKLKSTLGALENVRRNSTDECQVLQTEVKMRDEQMQALQQQNDELNMQLSVQQAENAALDEMLKLQQANEAKLQSQLSEVTLLRTENEKQMNAALEKTKANEMALTLQIEQMQLQNHEHGEQMQVTALQQTKDALQQQREQLQAEHEQQIAKLQEQLQEYNNKATKAANDLENMLALREEDNQNLAQRLQQLEANLVAEKTKQTELNTQNEQTSTKLKQEHEAVKAANAILELQLKTNEAVKAQQTLELDDLTRKHDTLIAKIDNLTQQNEALQAELTAARIAANELQTRQQQLNEQLANQQRASVERDVLNNEQRNNLEGTIETLKQNVSRYEKDMLELKATLQKTQEELNTKIMQFTALEEKTIKQELTINEAGRQQENLQARFDTLQLQNQTLENDLIALRTTSTDSNAELLKLAQDNQSKQKAYDELIEETNNERITLEGQLQVSQQRITVLCNQVETLTQELKQTSEQSSKHVEQLKATEELSNKQSLELSDLGRKLKTLNVKCAQLEEENKKLNEELNATHSSSTDTNAKLLGLSEKLANTQKAFDEQSDRHNNERLQLEKQLQELQQGLQSAQNEADNLRAQLVVATEAQQLQVSEFANLEAKLITKTHNELEEAKNMEAAERQRLINEFEMKLQKADEVNTNLNTAVNRLEEQLKLLQNEQEKAQEAQRNREVDLLKQLEALNNEKSKLTNDLEQKHEELKLEQNNNNQNTENLIKELTQMQKELNDTRDQLMIKNATYADIEQKLLGTCAELRTTQTALEEKQTNDMQIATKLEELQLANAELQSAIKEKENMLAKNTDFNTELNEHKKVIDEMDKAATKQTTKINSLESQIYELQQQLQEAKLECKNLVQQLEMTELEKAREVVTLQTRLNGTANQNVANIQELTDDSEVQINFLNSIIADMQVKNDTLKARILTLEAAPLDFTQTKAFDFINKRKPAPRVFCDICDVFDAHETEDCPLQASDERDYSPPPTMKPELASAERERKLPTPRKYCETCEVFGHEMGECNDDETF